ncbi:MAG: undecaprenyl diphosphate synthase family protein, partial [Nanoarchaeota archaeon]|nr:undecaprenyl diphosphate synthase family protein [Nanoarchaeota archaeon]
ILDNLLLLAAQQIETDIPVLTISLGQKIDMFNEMVFHEFLDTELQPFLEKNKVRTTFLGKWYSLPGMIVEAIKRILNATGDFDSLFLNICINYNGQEEICDASKAILQKIQMDKEDSDSITIETIKENIYSSYFIPPSIIIEMGKVFSGTFLWDSKGAKILFLRKDFSEFVKADVVKAIEYYNKE